jgi:hypothetical protein
MRTLFAGLMLLQTAPLVAQSGATTLEVRRNGTEIGREKLTLEDGRRRGLTGTTLTIAAQYPATAPIGVRLERSPDGQLALFQLDVERAAAPVTILAASNAGRLVLKTIAKGSDAAQELPGGADVVMLDEDVVGLFSAVADLATPAGARLTAIYPRSGRRTSLVAKRDGSRILLSGGVTGTLSLDPAGRLVRVELPSQGIVAVAAQ